MTEIAPIVANPLTIIAVILALVIWSGWSGFRLWVGSKRLLAELRVVTGQITAAEDPSGFTLRYETISQELGGNPILGARWREYQQALLIPEQGLIRATTRADDWFDLSLFRARPLRANNSETSTPREFRP